MNLETQRSVAWIVKHRPETISDVVGKEAKLVQKYLDSGNLPHFLFVSHTPGSGKSSLSKAIIHDTGADYLEINSSDERGIDTIRDKIKHFVSTMSSKPGVKKIVFLDEMDSMTKTAQEALRNMMETYMHNVTFILTANYINKIIEPVQNRCEVLTFGTAKKEDIKVYLKKICTVEDLMYDDEGLNKLIDIHYPSIRGMVSDLQKLSTLGQTVTPNFIHSKQEILQQLWDKLLAKKVLEVRKEIVAKGLEPTLFINFIYEKTLDGSLSVKQVVKLSKVLAELEYRCAIGADKKIQLLCGIFDIFSALMVK